MREEFFENSVGPENERMHRIFYSVYTVIFAITLIVAIVAFFFWFMLGDSGFLFILGTCAVFGSGVYFLRRKLLLYYDYTYISGELRVIKVINGKKRKKFLVFDCKNIKQLGKVGSDSFNKLRDTQAKMKIATPNGLRALNQLYYILATIDGEESLVILECEEKLLAYIVARRGREIIEKDYK